MTNATLAVSTTQQASAGYAQNVGTAARALVAALFAVPASTASDTHVVAKARPARKDLSLARLYRMANFDSVSPELVKELQHIAAR
jgi:hypothetical protein